MTGQSGRFLITAAAALAVSILPASSRAVRETTAPGDAPVTVYVIETDTGIKYSMWQNLVYEGQPAQVVAQVLQRGQLATFEVTNKGKRPHNFAAFGKATPKLAPGGKGHFKLVLLRRGRFPYESTLDKGKRGFRGTLTVY